MFVAKILILCTVCALAASHTVPAFGAPSQLEGKDLAEAQKTLQASLDKLAAGEGPHYRISKILSASYQVVSGSKNDYTVELIDSNGATKVCDVDIWGRSWLPNGIQVTFRCPNEPVLVKTHSS
ncbi:sarcocystatin-A [Drosophila serrata]|uniref:sarcocystatin-A n=1 Tax=Drosophila serrata TaxID=7274 RepID=UPI000A1D27E5|nr:sarcocystatin-A [Drosophila serrata]KAH8366955.1 hypothetical protein KR200_006207 [Drosophila serrata]